MDEIIEDLLNIQERCELYANLFNEDSVNSLLKLLGNKINEINKSWSGSWIGYHSTLYLDGLNAPRTGEFFDSSWGLIKEPANKTKGNWRKYSYDEIVDEIYRRAQIKDLNSLVDLTKETEKEFNDGKRKLKIIFDALLSNEGDKVIQELRNELDNLKSNVSSKEFIMEPKHYMSNDYNALRDIQMGRVVPHHLSFEAWLIHLTSYGHQIKKLAQIAEYAADYIKQKLKMKGKFIMKTGGKIFIGHGHSSSWLELQNFIRDRLHLEPDEFNREPTAGLSVKERLEAMLESASFAFLVMTAEDEHADNSIHARENVIHEVGLFQGKLSFRKAIVLLEEGCATFSNIDGLIQIRFPKGKISAKFEEIRHVLEREGILKIS